MLQLPLDLQEYILSFLNLADLVALARSSRELRDLTQEQVKKIRRAWQDLDSPDFSCLNLAEYQSKELTDGINQMRDLLYRHHIRVEARGKRLNHAEVLTRPQALEVSWNAWKLRFQHWHSLSGPFWLTAETRGWLRHTFPNIEIHYLPNGTIELELPLHWALPFYWES